MLTYAPLNKTFLVIIMKYIFIIIISLSIYSKVDAQNSTKFYDEFGNEFKEEELKITNLEQKYVLNDSVIIIKLKYYSGKIKNVLKTKIIEFLESKSGTQIKKDDRIIINAGIVEGNCNIQNMTSYEEYLERIGHLEKVSYFEILSKKKRKYKNQIIDENLLILSNFFKYHKWKMKRIHKCGGTLVIFPDNSFVRIIGDGDSFDVFEIVK